MTTERWDVGFISCSASKRPEGVTPITLYKGVVFTTQMKHAVLRCDRIIIVSAKYGLLELTDPVSWYDQYLGDLSEVELAEWRAKVTKQLEHLPVHLWKRRLSYLPQGYQDQLMLAAPWLAPLRRPYALNMFTQIRTLSNEIKNYGKQPSRRA